MDESLIFRGGDATASSPPTMPVPEPPEALIDGLLPRHTLAAKPLPLAPAPTVSTSPPASPPSDITILDPPIPVAAPPASPPSPPTIEATVPRPSVVRPAFLILLCLGLLLAMGTGLALYLSNLTRRAALSEPTLPPPALVTEDHESQEIATPTGPLDLTRVLDHQIAERNEEATNHLQADLADPIAPPELTTAPSESPELSALEALAQEVEEIRASQPDPVTPPPSNTTPLKHGGSIEKMDDDWLPPGVSRSE